MTASSPSKNSSSIGSANLRSFSAVASSSSTRRTGAAVVGADERDVLEQLRVVVAGDDQARAGGSRCAWQRRPKVHHPNLADGGLGLEGLFVGVDAERLEVRGDVRAGALERPPSLPGAGRSRPARGRAQRRAHRRTAAQASAEDPRRHTRWCRRTAGSDGEHAWPAGYRRLSLGT